MKMMAKKKILVMAPILTLPEDLGSVLTMLDFLTPHYELTGWDPLLELSSEDNNSYYQNWRQMISPVLHQYDALIGFSFGGVILQQCFSLLSAEHYTKPILLFSTPSFADHALNQKLGQVLSLAEKKQLQAANQLKMNYVLHPNPGVEISLPEDQTELGCARLIEGIQRILTTDSREVLQQSPVRYHHFIGEHSYLVNSANVIAGLAGELIYVPGASMRVLKDNSHFCYKKIEEILL